MLKVKIFNKFDNELKIIWSNLSNNPNCISHPFNQYHWNKLWYEIVIGKNQKIIIIVIIKNDQVIAILPLIEKKIIFNYLENFGSISADYCPILIDLSSKNIDEIIYLVINKIKSLNQNFINIEKIPFSLFECIKSNELKKKFIYEDLNTYLFDYKIDNSKDFNKKKHKNNLDVYRQIRRLKKIGLLEFKVFEKKNENFKDIIKKMISFKSAMYKKTNKRNIFKNNNYINFYKKLFSDKNIIETHISCLYHSGKIISVHLGFHYKNTFFYIMPSYDQDYSKYSPGKILLHYLLEHCEKKNIRYFDFTVGNEDYKKIWSNKFFKLYNLKKTLNFRGTIIKFCLMLKSKIRANKIIYKYYSVMRNII